MKRKSKATPLFNIAFYFVGVITIFTLIVLIVLSVIINNPNQYVVGVIETCDFAFKSGLGGILGLLGGKYSQ